VNFTFTFTSAFPPKPRASFFPPPVTLMPRPSHLPSIYHPDNNKTQTLVTFM
jgi:hypothetical protein